MKEAPQAKEQSQVPATNLTDEPDEPDRVDDEDTSSDVDVKPWDPAQIRITTQSFTIREVVDQIRDGDIDIAPDFQRGFVWNTRQRTRLVESILLGIPLPAFYFDQTEDGKYNVVDGVQRLSTITFFMDDAHTLRAKELEYLKHLDGCSYSELDPPQVRSFRATQIVVHVIEPQTPSDVKYDIFNRVNTSGSPLYPQEIRHAMSNDRSRQFLASLAESQEFDNATENKYWRKSKETNDWVRDSGRMTNRELVLRFCAFRGFSEETYRKFPSLDAYLMDFTNRIDNRSTSGTPLTDDDLAALRADFLRAMDNAYNVLEDAAFRRWPHNQQRRGPINRALFEAQANALAHYPKKQLLAKKGPVVAAFRNAINDPDYLLSVTAATGDPIRVKYRLEHTHNILRQILE